MRWVPLTSFQMAVAMTLLVSGVGAIALWMKTHHMDSRHGAMHLLFGGVFLAGAGLMLLVLEWLDRKRRGR